MWAYGAEFRALLDAGAAPEGLRRAEDIILSCTSDPETADLISRLFRCMKGGPINDLRPPDLDSGDTLIFWE
jgi:hypothetical protein